MRRKFSVGIEATYASSVASLRPRTASFSGPNIIIIFKPDIIISDNEKGTCMLIDAAISGDRNVIKKEAEKILKYKDLTIEIQLMRNVKHR